MLLFAAAFFPGWRQQKKQKMTSEPRIPRRRLRASDPPRTRQDAGAAARRMRVRRYRRRRDLKNTSTPTTLPATLRPVGDVAGRLHEPEGRHVDCTETGSTSYLIHVSHAAQAIAAGKCNAALITLAGRPRSKAPAARCRARPPTLHRGTMESAVLSDHGQSALCAQLYMHEFGLPEQLAWVKVAASHHAQYNPVRC